MNPNELTASERLKYIAILAGSWVSIVLLHTWAASSAKPMSQVMQLVGMATVFWTLIAAVYSIVFLLKILIGKCDQSWKVILFPTIILMDSFCVIRQYLIPAKKQPAHQNAGCFKETQ